MAASLNDSDTRANLDYALAPPGSVSDAPSLAPHDEMHMAPPIDGEPYPVGPAVEPGAVWPSRVNLRDDLVEFTTMRKGAVEFDDERQMTLRSLLGLLTASGAVMALLARLEPAVMAALLGVAALLAHWLLAAVRSRRLIWRLLAWLILGAYLLTAIAAVSKG